MTAHNHGYDPTCKETRLPDGKMVGECMTDTTNTLTPETVKRYIPTLWGGNARGQYLRMKENLKGRWVKHDDYTVLETRLRAAVDRTHEAQVQIIDLSSRLRIAEAEIAAMRSGEVVAWMHEGSSREGPMAFVTPGTYTSLKEKSPYTIPLYRSPAPDTVVEALNFYATGCGVAEDPKKVEDGDFDMARSEEKWAEDCGDRARASLAALTGQAKKGEG